jgi:hypothetical protein
MKFYLIVVLIFSATWAACSKKSVVPSGDSVTAPDTQTEEPPQQPAQIQRFESGQLHKQVIKIDWSKLKDIQIDTTDRPEQSRPDDKP